MEVLNWRKMPSGWMVKGDFTLSGLKWSRNYGSANAAALMVYYVLCLYASHRDDPISGLESGEAKITYKELAEATGISRAKVWEGLDVLKTFGLIEVSSSHNERNNIYKIINYNETPWCKVPLRKFVKNKSLSGVFSDFSLRKKTSLHAMKIFFLLLKFRDDVQNYTAVTYDKIALYTGITKNDIRPALSLLQHARLILLDRVNDDRGGYVTSNYRHNVYWIVGMNSRKHFGTNSKSHSIVEPSFF